MKPPGSEYEPCANSPQGEQLAEKHRKHQLGVHTSANPPGPMGAGNYTCTIQLGVDAEGAVKQWQLEWNATSTDAVPAETYKAWSTTCLKADDQVAPTATETPPAGVTASGS